VRHEVKGVIAVLTRPWVPPRSEEKTGGLSLGSPKEWPVSVVSTIPLECGWKKWFDEEWQGVAVQ